MARRKNKASRVPYLGVVAKQEPVDELAKRIRISRYGATERDWRDARWETPHGRLAIRGERWGRLTERAREGHAGTRDAFWITREEYEAACKFLDVHMAYLRAYGAPGLPSFVVSDEVNTCPICGASVKCEPCASDWQRQITSAMQSAWRAIDDASAVHKYPLRTAIDHLLMNGRPAADFVAEEALPHLVKPLRVALRALHEHFLGENSKVSDGALTRFDASSNVPTDRVGAS